MDYFDLLGIKKSYKIDQVILDKKYFSLQKKYHPDRANNPLLINKYLAISIEANKAYRVIKDDYLRGEYLLELSGIKMDYNLVKNHLSSYELEKIFNQLEDISNTNNLYLLKSIEEKKLIEKSKLLNQIAESFFSNNFHQALDLIIRLKYLNNIIINVRNKVKNVNNAGF